ncbi:ABC transporter ATP-binding protein [Clostridium butyricum]|uniref:ABC transporter ATP-binding protein n=2 Tax=Clostridium butyricum TaxID=1492 RepID=UPI0032C1D6FD|nr:ABC transporter ATP-binding protein [Clostridium butyricum]
MKISIKNLNKVYGNDKIFDNFSIEFDDDKVNCIVGESGCGKTTLLNIIAGLVQVDNYEINGITKKDISYVFQEDRLIPWLTIKENLEIALKQYSEKDEINKRVNKVLNLVGIDGIEDKYPHELSGGMKQRVNIARAFGKPSKIILMDEPFKSLDYKIKYIIIDEFIEILKKENRMVILVTHDLDEAIYFKGNIIVFGGRPVCVKGIFRSDLQNEKKKIMKLL